ncbi:galectin-1 [Lepus europaeus]|uniref:galectin-1 n=1 Tax=Lepus europaeus TaxID=9983 RepID=UPI002B47F231|nr:galectin-1 [Lepus europaeus]
MAGLVANNLKLQPGQSLLVRGEVAPSASRFIVNLGQDMDNLCLHFNPRFNSQGDTNTIVCNSKEKGVWGVEHREKAFPFQPGSLAEVTFSFNKEDLLIKLPDGHTFKFPNRLNLETIDYLHTSDDFKVKCMTID